jgi:hypothetical protein
MDHKRKWDDGVEGTSFFPRHRRWDCRKAIISALRDVRDPMDSDYESAAYYLGRAQAFNAIMFDFGDMLAPAYAERIEKLKKLINARKAG